MRRFWIIPVLLLSGVALAQINGVPASVTSTNGNFRATWNPPASVTSLGRNGYSMPPCTGIGLNQLSPPCVIGGGVPEHRRHHGRGGYEAPYAYSFYPYYNPYGYEEYTPPAPPPPAAEPEPTAPAPTIFDRSGNGYASAPAPPAALRPAAEQPAATPQPEAPPQPQETVTLIFRDGKRLDITNYAIMGGTLFDLTPGHVPRKIALSELDLPATIKLNDDRGVDFQLPKPHA